MTFTSRNHCTICNTELLTCIDGIFDTRFGIDRTYAVEHCDVCGAEYTLPVPNPEELKGLYETYYNFGGEKGTRYTKLRELFLFSAFYRLFLTFDGDISFHGRRGFGRLLDIGCNEGRGLKLYRHNGFFAEGLELNETAAAVARSQGYTVFTQTLDRFRPDVPYDVAVLSNVLEHSLDPKNMVKDVHRILKPGGRIWISCPNNRSWLRSIFGRYWINWHVPFHLIHFSPPSLIKVLEDVGFDQIEIRQETPALWAAHSVIVRTFAKKGMPTKQLRNPLLTIFLILFWRVIMFPFLWLGNKLGRGDCLVVTARKR
jgi:SAM-dependent methyltransferase